jgi:hypothetical protein
MNEFIEVVGEFKMKTQRLSNLAPVSIKFYKLMFSKITCALSYFIFSIYKN